MNSQPKILAFAGSTRSASYNKKLIRIAVQAAREAGAEVTIIDLKDLPMPLYDGDLEKSEGLPENAVKLKELMLTHDGLMISAPEYNSSISGVLKNAIDWASRAVPGEPSLAAFDGKVAALMSASTGALGGLRGLAALRSVLGNSKVLVLPEQVGIPKAAEAFDENGNLTDEKKWKAIESLAHKLVYTIGKLKS